MPQDEIMMSVTPNEALRQAEIHAMRALVDAITAQGKQQIDQAERVTAHMDASNRALEKFGMRIDNMNERLIRLEEQKHGREIDNLRRDLEKVTLARDKEVGELKAKVDKLESKDDQRSGVRQFLEWLPKFAPWFIGIIGAIVAWQAGKAT